VLAATFVPGASPVHRAPAGLKLAVLAVGLLLVALLPGPVPVAVGALVVAVLVAVAGVGLAAVAALVRPVLWVLVPVVVVQVWLAGPVRALVVGAGIVVAVAAAGLVTLTTRTEDLLDALVTALGPLRRTGVDPERVALVLALAVRSVPVLAGIAGEVQQARAARGAERSLRAFAVPFVIRSLRHADRLGEALEARGVDDR
jgi:biotin transport system permease protein